MKLACIKPNWVDICDTVILPIFKCFCFIWLIFQYQSRADLLHVLCAATFSYAVIFPATAILLRKQPERRKKMLFRERLIFQWIYIAVYLTIAQIEMINCINGMNGPETSLPQLIYWVLVSLYVALIIPRNILIGRLLRIFSNKRMMRKADSIESG
jgi:magnesium-transporting ATPase (P-type)